MYGGLCLCLLYYHVNVNLPLDLRLNMLVKDLLILFLLASLRLKGSYDDDGVTWTGELADKWAYVDCCCCGADNVLATCRGEFSVALRAFIRRNSRSIK